MEVAAAVEDAAAPPVWPDANLGHVRFVINKVDLPPVWPIDATDGLCVSAQTGLGMPELCQALSMGLVPDVPSPGAAVPFTPKLAETISECRRLAACGECLAALEKLEWLDRECD